MNKMVKNKRGAWAMQELGIILLVVLTIIIISINFIPKLTKSSQTGKLFDAGDCDLDGAVNIPVDQCPCISTDGLEGELRGCPLGASKEASNLDKLTCGWFLTSESSCGGLGAEQCYQKDSNVFYSNCDGDNEKKCVKKIGGKYKTRCDQVSETAIGVSEKKGLAGNWDLSVRNLKIFDESKEDSEVQEGEAFDLENDRNFQPITAEFEVENVGAESIPRPFIATVEICNENKEGDSCETKDSLEIGPLKSKEKHKLLSLAIKVGENDYCAGGTEGKCYLRVGVDSKNELAELDETNNGMWFFIWLKNKKSEKVDWQKFKSIEIFADSGEKPDFRAQIRRSCDGFLGSDECPYLEGDCNSQAKNELLNSGCMVYATDDNLGRNDCGTAGVKAGFILPNLKYESMIKDIVTPFQGDKDAGDLFTYNWQSNQGSLACGLDKLWYLCDNNRLGKVLPIGSKKLRCEQDGSWKELSGN